MSIRDVSARHFTILAFSLTSVILYLLSFVFVFSSQEEGFHILCVIEKVVVYEVLL